MTFQESVVPLTIRLFALTAVLATTAGPAHGQVQSWMRQFGTSSVDYGQDVAVHPPAAFVVGLTGGTLPGESSAGQTDAFVRKYGLDGSEEWTHQFGSSLSDAAHGVAADGSGIYVVGATGGTLPGQTNAGSLDAFVRKYDVDGNVVWTRQFGSSAADIAGAVVVHGTGIYVAGVTSGALPGQSSAGSNDGFVRKYDVDGNELWTRQFGTSGDDSVVEVAVRPDDGLYAVGVTSGTLPGQNSAGLDDAFIRKYDLDGNEIWTRQFGSSLSDSASAVTVHSRFVYVAGTTGGILPGENSAGNFDAFIRKYDRDGNEIWTRQFGSSFVDVASAATAHSTDVYVIGETGGAVSGTGDFDVFVTKFDRIGNTVWTSEFGSSAFDSPRGADMHSKDVYVAGLTQGALPGQSSGGFDDAFVVRLRDTADAE